MGISKNVNMKHPFKSMIKFEMYVVQV